MSSHDKNDFVKHFYEDDNYYINITLIYVNNKDNIDKIKQEIYLLPNKNIITCEELIQLLKKYKTLDNHSYSLFSMLKYNFNVTANNLPTFVEKEINGTDFFSTFSCIDNISFDKTITMFQDINELIIIYKEKKQNVPTRKNIKKIILNKKNKRTRRLTFNELNNK
jgi:hypothetical protein